MEYQYKKRNWFQRQGYLVKAGILTAVFLVITQGIEFLFDRSEFLKEAREEQWGWFLLKKITTGFILANIILYLLRNSTGNKPTDNRQDQGK